MGLLMLYTLHSFTVPSAAHDNGANTQPSANHTHARTHTHTHMHTRAHTCIRKQARVLVQDKATKQSSSEKYVYKRPHQRHHHMAN